MPWPRDVDHVEVMLVDDAVQIHAAEVLPRYRATMTEQYALDLREREPPFQQRIVSEKNLAAPEIVRRAPVGVDSLEKI